MHSKLFSDNHVPDIVGTSGAVPTEGSMTKQEIVTALKDTCVFLNKRKAQFELMIHTLERKVPAENELEESGEVEVNDVEDDNADGNEDASGKEDFGNNSEENE